MIFFFSCMFSFVEVDGKYFIFWCELDNICMLVNDYLFFYFKNVIFVSWRYGLMLIC